MASVRGRVGSASVAALLIGAVLACGNLQQDELDCEEAVAVLEGCCPDFPGSFLSCTYEQTGCGTTYYPDLSIDESRCIRGESCATIVSSGVCDRALRLGMANPNGLTDAGAAQGVCP